MDKLNIDNSLKNNLKDLGYKELTKIQEESLPLILQGYDLVAKAKTGSGKTAAFGIGLLEKLQVKRFQIQSLILCPTRELADQVAIELRKIARYKHNVKILTLCGGVPSRRQAHSLRHGAHIIVGTPGRVLFHLKQNNLDSINISSFVLDEADRMLDMGFYDDIKELVSYLPKKRQNLLFSATYEENIQVLANEFLEDAKFVSIDETHSINTIKEYFINSYEKQKAVTKILAKFVPNSVIIFCNTKIACDHLDSYLHNLGFDPLVLHSDYEQYDRDEIITLFANGSYPILIATDVASRGLDIDDIELVLNYDMANDINIHTHRIGRTARAGKNGVAVTLFQNIDDDKLSEYKQIKEIEYLNEDQLNDEVKILKANYKTIYVSGGKKLKLRPTDILGSLIKDIGLNKEDIGKIKILPMCSYVAIKKDAYEEKLKNLKSVKIKNKFFRIYDR